MLNKWLYRVFVVSFIALLLLFLFVVIYSNITFSPEKFYLKKFRQYKQDPTIAYFLANKLLSFSQNDTESGVMTLINRDILKGQDHSNIGYYHMLLGLAAYQHNNKILAAFHFKRVLYEQNIVVSKDMVYTALRYLGLSETDLYQKILYINTILEHYNYQAEDKGGLYYELGKSYDGIGDWDRAYKAYAKFLTFPVDGLSLQAVHQRTDIFRRVQRHMYDHTYSGYTWNTPEKARIAVRNAFYSFNGKYIKQLESPHFFTTQWQESVADSNAFVPTFDIVPVLSRSNVSFSHEFSTFSTENEKLWKTVGWERVGTWYLAFQRISQPDSADINGKWEWAGIYFGIGSEMYVPQ